MKAVWEVAEREERIRLLLDSTAEAMCDSASEGFTTVAHAFDLRVRRVW